MTTSRQIYRPDPVQHPGRYPSAGRLERLERMVLGMHGVGSTFVGLYPNGIAVGGGAGLDLSKFCFGLSISGATATITAGEVQWGTSIFGIGTTSIAISEDLQYIGIEATYETAVLIGPDSNLATFRSTPDTIRTWLYQFNWKASSTPGVAASVSLRRIGKPPGNWVIGSEFSPQ